jgi:hypothetical protein
VQALDTGAFVTPIDVWVLYGVEWLEGRRCPSTIQDRKSGGIRPTVPGRSVAARPRRLIAVAHHNKIAHRDGMTAPKTCSSSTKATGSAR